MTAVRFKAWLVAIPVLCAGLACTPAPGQQALPLAEIMVSGGTSRHVFRVEVATTPAEIQRGLQGRQTLPPDGGMLLLAGEPRNMRMWMKDTPVALDMLFFDADWIIRAITPNARPHSKRLIPSPGPVAGVLELAALPPAWAYAPVTGSSMGTGTRTPGHHLAIDSHSGLKNFRNLSRFMKLFSQLALYMPEC